MAHYKFLTKEHKGPYSNFDYSDYLPRGKRPGKWLPAIDDDLVKCARGYHGCERRHLARWLNDDLYEIEYRGEVQTDEEKAVGAQMRFVKKIDEWNDRTARELAYLAAKSVLPNYEKQYPGDKRVRDCLRIVRRYLDGKATSEELDAAGAAAAGATAARATAAWDAARAAAAWAAARDAAWAAARDAAWAAAAGDAAAWAAAGAAAAGAAAARDAAARDAAWDAARAAAYRKISYRLVKMLKLQR